MENILTIQKVKKVVKQAIAESLKNRNIMISDLKSDELQLIHPIPIFLEYDSDTVIANYYDTESFGYGDTDYEAINDLCRELVETYWDLKTSQGSLGFLPQKWWKHLQTIIREVQY
jgi:hypothetical protein